MDLLLLKYRTFQFAVAMGEVSRIIHNPPAGAEPERCLLDPGATRDSVILKSDYLLPASKVEEMISVATPPAVMNFFLKGCLKKNIFQGFVIYKERIYGLLSSDFLKKGGQGDQHGFIREFEPSIKRLND